MGTWKALCSKCLLFSEIKLKLLFKWQKEERQSDLAYNMSTVGVHCSVQISSLSFCCSRGKGMSSSRSALFSTVVRRLMRPSTSSSCDTVYRFLSFNRSPSVTVRRRICWSESAHWWLLCARISWKSHRLPGDLLLREMPSWFVYSRFEVCCVLSSAVSAPSFVCGRKCGSVSPLQKSCQDRWEVGRRLQCTLSVDFMEQILLEPFYGFIRMRDPRLKITNSSCKLLHTSAANNLWSLLWNKLKGTVSPDEISPEVICMKRPWLLDEIGWQQVSACCHVNTARFLLQYYHWNAELTDAFAY
jgi:hypothetical protein